MIYLKILVNSSLTGAAVARNFNLDVLLTVHLSIILATDQLNAQNLAL